MEQDRIITGKGLWKQLEESNKHSYSKFDMTTLKSALSNFNSAAQLKRLRDKAFAAFYKIEKSMFSSEETKILFTMIESSDIESIQMAEMIINTKIK